ncbi:MAG TPA: phosphate signaling complex protein PhoU [Pseudonocardiaceae bacterium]|nr:phosphate signaling complex protein PhoU [Pseudonocardiaceae bacterium]
MREVFHQELQTLLDRMVELTRLVETAMGRATTALLDADLELAESVIATEGSVQDLYHELDDRVLRLLALQQPVATDLRTVVAALRIGADLERMGVLARHVAEVAKQQHPQPAVPPQLRATILAMGQVAGRIVAKAGSAIASREADFALELEQDDDEMDRLQEALYRHLLNGTINGTYQPDAQTTMNLTLIGRYYERFADHAVSVARRVAFLAGKRALDCPPAPPLH